MAVYLAEEVTTPSAAGASLFGRTEHHIKCGRLTAGLDDLCAGLTDVRESVGCAEWPAFTRSVRGVPLMDLLHEDPLTRRAFQKPRGYAGDAVMMDYVYGLHAYVEAAAGASPLGKDIFEWVRNRPASRGVRFRREHIAHLIDALADGSSQPHVLALAAGHLREIEESTAARTGRVGRFVALDPDRESLREVTARYGHLGVETVNGSVRDLFARNIPLGRFDFVYAAGLYDYLSNPMAQVLTGRMFDLTNPGGQLLIPNFAPCCPDRAYLETFMAWDLMYRDEFDMARLLEQIPSKRIASYDIYSDPSGSIVYLLVKKAA
jgi:extracellular factor (EF) 3-hydroxypalmitic acid methyl ester biosynthesis protein